TLFLRNFAESMGYDRFTDREGLHLTAPGWGVLGVLYHDLAVRLKVPDLPAAARRIGSIDWRRSAPMWSEIVRQRVDKEGRAVLGLAAGGSQNRRFITQKIRQELHLNELLEEHGFTAEGEEQQAELDLDAESSTTATEAGSQQHEEVLV